MHTGQGQVTSLQMDLVELEVRRAREAEKVSRNDGGGHDDGDDSHDDGDDSHGDGDASHDDGDDCHDDGEGGSIQLFSLSS